MSSGGKNRRPGALRAPCEAGQRAGPRAGRGRGGLGSWWRREGWGRRASGGSRGRQRRGAAAGAAAGVATPAGATTSRLGPLQGRPPPPPTRGRSTYSSDSTEAKVRPWVPRAAAPDIGLGQPDRHHGHRLHLHPRDRGHLLRQGQRRRPGEPGRTQTPQLAEAAGRWIEVLDGQRRLRPGGPRGALHGPGQGAVPEGPALPRPLAHPRRRGGRRHPRDPDLREAE